MFTHLENTGESEDEATTGADEEDSCNVEEKSDACVGDEDEGAKFLERVKWSKTLYV